MIRDPSDGSVRVPAVEADQAPLPRAPLFAAIEAALLAGKVRPERLSDQWIYQRAWNDGIDFALTQILKIEKEQP